MGIKKNKSFTLIELIVAVGVVGLVLPAIFNIFFIIIRQQLVLVAYQEMTQQGDSVRRNIKNILQNRTAYITDSNNTETNMCPLITTPTPTFSPDLYIRDREGKFIHLYQAAVDGVQTIASDSAVENILVPTKTYYLSSKDVIIPTVGFSCYHVNEFTPAIVTTQFTVQKSTEYKDVSFPYTFTVKLRSY